MKWPSKDTLSKKLLHFWAATGLDARQILRILALAAIYFVVAWLGFTFAPGEQVTAIWPAAGVALASILLFGYRMWPGILLGSFLSKLSVHLPVWMGLSIAVGNTLEPLFGAWLLLYYVGRNHYLESLKGVLGLWFFSAFVSTLVSATIGTTAVWLSGLQPEAEYSHMFLTWWLADAGGSLIITPLLLAWAGGAYFMPSLRIFVEAIALLVVSVVSGIIILIHPETAGNIWGYPYMVFPLVIWAAIRFGQRGITLMTLGIANIVLSATLYHMGPFAGMPVEQGLIAAQMYVMIVAMIGLTVCAAISERRTAEKQAHASLKHLQNVIDHIPDPVLIKDGRHYLVGGNKALWEMLNGPPEKFIDRNCDDIFLKKEEAEAFNEKYDKVFSTGETNVSEETFTDQGGKRHVLSIKIALLQNDKPPPLLVAVARDITSLKETENLLVKYTLDLENRNRELDDFAYVTSHDLKEPLRGMNIVASLLMEDYRDKLDAEVVRRLQRLTFLSQRMILLVNDLLRFSRLGHADLVAQEVDPNRVIADIQKMIESLMKEKNADILVLHDIPHLVCDKTGLEEVLSNLISNGIKYNDSGSKLVEVGMLESAESPRGHERNVFYVKDNGIGIKSQHHQDVFRIFKRLPDSAKYDESGAGVGLTFVKKIVERNNGCIWLKSEPGKGSTFYFTLDGLPLQNPAAA